MNDRGFPRYVSISAEQYKELMKETRFIKSEEAKIKELQERGYMK